MERLEGLIETEKSKKNNLAWIPFLIIIVAFFITFGFIFGYKETPDEKLLLVDVKVSSTYFEGLGYSPKVIGKAKNVTNKNFSYVRVEFVVYDSQNNNLGTFSATKNNLMAGDVWSFVATGILEFYPTEPVSFKVFKIESWG